MSNIPEASVSFPQPALQQASKWCGRCGVCFCFTADWQIPVVVFMLYECVYCLNNCVDAYLLAVASCRKNATQTICSLPLTEPGQCCCRWHDEKQKRNLSVDLIDSLISSFNTLSSHCCSPSWSKKNNPKTHNMAVILFPFESRIFPNMEFLILFFCPSYLMGSASLKIWWEKRISLLNC